MSIAWEAQEVLGMNITEKNIAENIDSLNNVAGNVNAQLKKLETFVARRFDELSMEVNATSQLMDMAEEGLRRHFLEILEILKAINFHGEGSSPANTGVELEAVVHITEQAANSIMDAADKIVSTLNVDDDWKDDSTRKKAIDNINQNIQDIIIACNFQDLTGQRIRKAIENLENVEKRLNETLQKLGLDTSGVGKSPDLTPGSSQGDIDELFG